MTGPVRRLLPDDGDQVVRLSRFRAAHPDVVVAAGEFGTWQARIPEGNGETIITRHRLGELLDRLGEVTGQPGPGLRGPRGAIPPAPRAGRPYQHDRTWPAAFARTLRVPPAGWCGHRGDQALA